MIRKFVEFLKKLPTPGIEPGPTGWKANDLTTVELPNSKLGPSQQKVYYKEVFYYKEVSKFPLIS